MTSSPTRPRSGRRQATPRIEIPRTRTRPPRRGRSTASVEARTSHPTWTSPSLPPSKPRSVPATASGEPAAEGAGPRVSRFTLAGGVARAGGGARRHGRGACSLRPGSTRPAPAVAAGRTNLDEIQALKENVVQARVELAALKVSIDSANRNAERPVHQDRRAHRAHRAHSGRTDDQAQQSRRDARSHCARRRRLTTQGSHGLGRAAGHANGPKASRRNRGRGWVVRDVHRGTALIEGRMGIIEVEQGDLVPGLGRVDAIRKQDGRWVVVTSRGLITSGR